MKKKYPILEFDYTPTAIIEPSGHINPIDIAEHCILCFFLDAINKVRRSHRAKIVFESKWESGIHHIYEIRYKRKRLSFLHPGVGAPHAAAMLEQSIALGCKKFIVCGGAGVIEKNLHVGHVIVPTSAIRDEGTSYHYLPPAREIKSSPKAVAAIEQILMQKGIKYELSKTWTTDAPYRETKKKVQLRCREGCLTVEMEAAALFSIAQFRGVTLGQILYAGDDVSGDEWDDRRWQSRDKIREELFWLAADACLKL